MIRLLWLLLVLCVGCDGCKRDAADASASASGSAPPPLPQSPSIEALAKAEQSRSAQAVSSDALTSRDPETRRYAARALARIADEPAAKRLEEALSDEDPAVVSWAAYGLGFACRGREPGTVRALVARAAALEPSDGGAEPSAHPDLWPPIAAIADALARCASIEAEHTLRAWLDGNDARAEAAALALGRLASRSKRLDDASIVALLDAASRPERPLDTALFAFSRLGGLAQPIQERLLSVARDSLRADGRRRAYAIRALGRAGPNAVELLAQILVDPKQDPVLRAIAARELAKLGEPAQKALAGALGKLVEGKLGEQTLLSAAWGPLAATLEGLTRAEREDRPMLEKLAELPIPSAAKPAVKRRLVEVRCRSAALLASGSSLYPALVRCDPDTDGRIGKLALVRVLGRDSLTGARHSRWYELSQAKDAVVRQAALDLLATHPETAGAWKVLAAALRSDRAGTVAVAARILADHPTRASEPPKKQETKEAKDKPPIAVKPEQAVVEALTHAFEAKWPSDAVETRAALIDAAGALQLLSLKTRVAKHCDDENPTLRQAAEKALHLLGERTRQCRRAKPSTPPPDLGSGRASEVKLAFDTDVGELTLTLDARLAPVTAARITDLVRSGFYDGIVFHRVVPGFVVQFGDPGGDGYGGAGREPLRCETSPLSFEAEAVGIALAGRDTGSSQLFVTLAPYPHLDGDYPLIGRAGPGWDRLAQGDVIKKARLVD